MRTFGKNDFKDFEFVSDHQIGKFYQAKDVEAEEKRTILILEAENLHNALVALNEGFLYNGIKHKNLLKFYGCYLNETSFQSDFMEEDQEDEEKLIKIFNHQNLIGGTGVTYQVGLITESFEVLSLQSYLNYYQSNAKSVQEDKIWLILTQLSDLLCYCQENKILHYDIRPQTIFVRNDHKTLALSFFGSAIYMGKYFSNKEALPYLAPKIYSSFDSPYLQESNQRTYKDSIYSLGLLILQFCILNSQDNDSLTKMYSLNSDKSEETLNNLLQILETKNYSKNLQDVIFQMLRYEESKRIDFIELDKMIKEIVGKENFSNEFVTLITGEDKVVIENFFKENCRSINSLGNTPKQNSLLKQQLFQPFSCSDLIKKRMQTRKLTQELSQKNLEKNE